MAQGFFSGVGRDRREPKMHKERAITLGCVFIGLSVLTQTAYTIYRDRSAAETDQRQRQMMALAAADAERLVQAKAAWRVATRHMAAQLTLWFYSKSEPPAPSYQSVVPKVYARSDVTWHDPKTVTVRGYVIATPYFDAKGRLSDPQKFYSWSNELFLGDDDVWRTASGAVFKPADRPQGAMFAPEDQP